MSFSTTSRSASALFLVYLVASSHALTAVSRVRLAQGRLLRRQQKKDDGGVSAAPSSSPTASAADAEGAKASSNGAAVDARSASSCMSSSDAHLDELEGLVDGLAGPMGTAGARARPIPVSAVCDSLKKALKLSLVQDSVPVETLTSKSFDPTAPAPAVSAALRFLVKTAKGIVENGVVLAEGEADATRAEIDRLQGLETAILSTFFGPQGMHTESDSCPTSTKQESGPLDSAEDAKNIVLGDLGEIKTAFDGDCSSPGKIASMQRRRLLMNPEPRKWAVTKGVAFKLARWAAQKITREDSKIRTALTLLNCQHKFRQGQPVAAVVRALYTSRLRAYMILAIATALLVAVGAGMYVRGVYREVCDAREYAAVKDDIRVLEQRLKDMRSAHHTAQVNRLLYLQYQNREHKRRCPIRASTTKAQAPSSNGSRLKPLAPASPLGSPLTSSSSLSPSQSTSSVATSSYESSSSSPPVSPVIPKLVVQTKSAPGGVKAAAVNQVVNTEPAGAVNPVAARAAPQTPEDAAAKARLNLPYMYK